MTSLKLIGLVDDSTDYRFIIQQIFNQYLPTYALNLYPSGQALLDELAASKPKPGLIVLDYHMPDLDGYQTLLRLQRMETAKHIPVVMMSAQASLAEKQACYQAGAQAFLLKPTHGEALRVDMAALCHDWLDSHP